MNFNDFSKSDFISIFEYKSVLNIANFSSPFLDQEHGLEDIFEA